MIKNLKFKIKNSQNGLSLIEAIVGVSLMLIIFVGLLIVFRMGIIIVSESRARVGAVALASQQMESIRNLPYDEVGTSGGIPPGNILQTENIVLNGITHTRRTLIQYVDDPTDGEGVGDVNGVTADYKKVKIEVSWPSRSSSRPVILVSSIMPKGIETNVGGGTLIINVFDASIAPVASADVHIENNIAIPPVSVDVFTNISGKVLFPGAPTASSYEVTVTKGGYSTSKTYDVTAGNPNPEPGHYTILEGETTEASFSIDLLSAKTIETYEPGGAHFFADSFGDDSYISATSSTEAGSGVIKLEEGAGTGFEPSGYAISTSIVPENLINWDTFSWTENKPVDTDILYHVLFASTTGWINIPDSDLAGNSAGFGSSPVDLSLLNISNYPTLRIEADLSTTDASTTPSVLNWLVEWDSNRIPIPFVDFEIRGNKTIGTDSGGDPIYKYLESHTTNDAGYIRIEDLEWDNYLVSVDGGVMGYDISESCPFQPVSISPGTNDNYTYLFLTPHQNNTLLVYVEDTSGVLVVGASVRLFRTGYNETKSTSATCGQVFFSPISAFADYELEVTKVGFEDANLTNVNVSGQTSIKVTMSQL